MKKMLLIVPILVVSLFNISCDKEDGDIYEWVGQYRWVENSLSHYRHNIVGNPTLINTEGYKMGDNLIIKDDKTWAMPNSKGLGITGQVKCYKDHINLLGLATADYCINADFDFKIINSTETSKKWLDYTRDESAGRITGEFYYTIRHVYFIFLPN